MPAVRFHYIKEARKGFLTARRMDLKIHATKLPTRKTRKADKHQNFHLNYTRIHQYCFVISFKVQLNLPSLEPLRHLLPLPLAQLKDLSLPSPLLSRLEIAKTFIHSTVLTIRNEECVKHIGITWSKSVRKPADFVVSRSN